MPIAMIFLAEHACRASRGEAQSSAGGGDCQTMAAPVTMAAGFGRGREGTKLDTVQAETSGLAQTCFFWFALADSYPRIHWV